MGCNGMPSLEASAFQGGHPLSLLRERDMRRNGTYGAKLFLARRNNAGPFFCPVGIGAEQGTIFADIFLCKQWKRENCRKQPGADT